MQYVELNCTVTPIETGNDMLIAFLSELGYESFVETETGLLAYIPKSIFDRQKVETLYNDHPNWDFTFSFSFKDMEDQNWNAVWESNYEAVLIDSCYIRAPFHPKREKIQYEIIIEPKMSFGTAHHQTTSLMIQYLLNENCDNKNVLDMGTGTGILSILAALRGAKSILAIDNDTWAYENCRENVEKNHISVIDTVLGDANNIGNRTFDLVLANINRNVLLHDIKIYANTLIEHGVLLLSGFYLSPDLQVIKEEAENNNLLLDSYKEQDNWIAARFLKIKKTSK
ncbi:MAG: 50S ribosomal protein L11 methyltransferase [Bacteroidales bacterium]|jgi:ribosomal protein L11 methyltransferase|nr:50S ribosomal protein L11 methyltransferase [Bacteroidales bacterium]